MMNSDIATVATASRIPQLVDPPHDLQQTAIGRELHDNIGQQLTGLGLLARGLSSSLDATDDRVKRGMDQLVEGLQRALADVRSLSHGLIDAPDVDDGLAESLDRLARATREQAAVDCDFDHRDGAEVVDPRAIRELLRIAQEAVQNALRHADPTKIELRLDQDGDRIRLVIRDDGRGLPETDVATGRGLRNMKQRASAIGADLRIGRQHHGGTAVSCTFREELS